MSFDPKPLRWIELDLPHPEGGGRLVTLRTDGPFALRDWYYVPESEVKLQLHLDQRTPEGGLTGCLHCGHEELYTRKKFNKTLGFTIVGVAALLVLVFKNYWSLVVAGLLDFALYRIAKDEVVCYSCSAVHRGFGGSPRHPAFDRTIEERLKFGEKAVMGEPMREGGTAGAPDPEH